MPNSVHHGATRVVLLVGAYAVKLPTLAHGWRGYLRGLLANMQEREFSRAGWPELCPVLFALPGGFGLVMRRARPLNSQEWMIFLSQHLRTPVCEPHYIDCGDYALPSEVKPDSFGMLDGRVVAVDYGN